MMPPELKHMVMRAEISVEQYIPALIGGLIAALGFFVSRAFTRADSNRDDIGRINQSIGLLNAAKERAKEEDERHRDALDAHAKELKDLRDRIVRMEARVDRCERGE